MKRYQVYKKEDKLPAVKEIPAHWGVVRNSLIFKEVSETGYGHLELLSILSDRGIIKQSETGRKERAPEDRSSYKRILKGDIGYNLMNAFIGSIGVSNYEGIISPAYAVCRPKVEIDGNYFHYLFRTDLYLTEFDRYAYGIMYERNRLYFENFKRIYVPFPPVEEQKQIARFLDRKLEQIDHFISNKQRLIELLKEQKTAIANRAVTKGLNPHAPIKNSGIECLGEIPAHWQVKRNKYIFKEINERSETGKETYLAMSQRLGLVERSQLGEQHLSTSENQIGYKLCQVNDLVLNKLKAYLGVFCKASISGLVSPDYTVFRAIVDIEVDYFEYLFKTPAYIAEFNKLSTGIVIGFFRLYTPDFYNIYSLFPPLDEQKEIVQYIKNESLMINEAITKIEKEIELIQEYRTTLISDAVTGKIDVRDTSVVETTLTTAGI